MQRVDLAAAPRFVDPMGLEEIDNFLCRATALFVLFVIMMFQID
jgi:hypothetical protein